MTFLDALIRFAAELPDPGAPMFPTLCAGHGGFLGGVIAWRQRRPIGPYMAGGSVVGFGVGYICWLTAVAIDRL
jgi:hypothetical protein